MAFGRAGLAVTGLAVALTLWPCMTVSAAPPKPTTTPDPPESCDCDEMVAREDCAMVTARELNGQGLEKFEQRDYPGAIEVWERAITLLPEAKRDTIRVPLAHAYRGSYELDGDTRHLHEALSLFREQLAATDVGDAATRSDLELEIASIEAQLHAIEAEQERLEREQLESLEREQAALRQAALNEASAKHDRDMLRLQRSLEISGVVVGTGLLVAGGLLLSYDDICSDRSVAVLETCPRVFEATAPGISTLAIGSALLATSVVFLAINERRNAQKNDKQKTRTVAFAAPTVLRF